MSSINKMQTRILISMILVNVFEFFDLFIIGFIISLIIDDNAWNLNNYKVSAIIISSGIGAALGYFVFGFITDKIGRLRTIKFCILLVSCSNFLSCILPSGSWLLLVFFRFLIGLGAGGINVSVMPYLQEFFPDNNKGFFSGLMSSFVPVGLSLGSLATYLFSDVIGWRGLFFLGFSPIVILFCLNNLPESPYFLNLHNNDSGDVKKNFNRELQCIIGIFEKNKFNIALISIGSFCFMTNSVIIQSWGQVMLHDLFVWNKDEISRFFVFVSLFNFLGRFLFSLVSDSFERKNILFTCGILGALGSFITSISFLIIYYNTVYYSSLVFSFGILFIMTFGDGAFSVINTFSSEVFSDRHRSICLGISHGIASIAKIFGPTTMGYLYSHGMFLQYSNMFFVFLFFLFLFLLGGCAYFFVKKI